jgi:phenylacetate-CoA ligase
MRQRQQRVPPAKGKGGELRMPEPAPLDVSTNYRSIIAGAQWPPLLGKRGSALLAMQYQFKQSERWPLETIRKAQFSQLQGLLRHANETVPYYRKRFSEAGFNATAPLDEKSWASIPLLMRHDIQQAGDEFISTAIPESHRPIRAISTSGSSGTPVTIQTTRIAQFYITALTLRDNLWHNLDFSQKIAAIRLPKNEKDAAYPDGRLAPSWGMSVQPVYVTGPSALLNIMTPVHQQAEWLLRQKPAYLLTYPSNLMELLHHYKENAIRIPELRAVVTFGEILHPEIREACREIWGTAIIDMYSTQEVGYIALQCPEHEHYHVQCENVLAEVLDEAGAPCKPGETGRVVVTALHNFATPLIRYSLGDYAKVGEPCSCGRTLPVLTRVMGRVRNMMTLPSGGKVWPYFGANKLGNVVPVRQYQLVQKTLTELELRVVPERPMTADDEAKMRAVIFESLGQEFQLVFSYHDEILRGPGAKYEDFKSELPR